MRVLHLPVNIASQVSVTVRALRDIGVEARGLVRNNRPSQDDRGIETFVAESRKEYPIRGRLQRRRWRRAVLDAVRWADVVHWHSGADASRLRSAIKLAVRLNKARIIEFWGSDARIPEIASADNLYVAELFEQDPEGASQARKRSLKVQSFFARHGFNCFDGGVEVAQSIQRDLFPSPYRNRTRLMMSEYEPSYPDPGRRRPVLTHCPSHQTRKGTEAVLRAVGELEKAHDFEFRLIRDMPHSEALAMLRECDVLLDQFVFGTHGMAALEAMALGKPVACYIKPSMVPLLPDNLPIVNANRENLAEMLVPLLEDGARRHELGRRGRAFVEQHHDAHKVARDLVRVYGELLQKTRGRRRRA